MFPAISSTCLRRVRSAQQSFAIKRFGTFLILAAAFASWSASANDEDGSWSPLIDWPLITVHAAVTPDMRVLSYGTRTSGQQTGFFEYDIWDPAAGTSMLAHMTLANLTLTDLFCSSQVILPQSGEIFIAGGDNWTGSGTTNTGNNNSNLFDYSDNTLVRSANMFSARWYSSSTVMTNGEVYIQGGNGGSDRPEVRQLDGTFRLLSNANTSSYAATFPRNFLAPDGRVFGIDNNGKMFFVATANNGSLSGANQLASANAGWTSGAAMFLPGVIAQMGGNSNGLAIIDINGPVPAVTIGQSMSSRRQWVSTTVLADGKVLATGGSQTHNQMTNVAYSADIWDPDTGQWHVGPPDAVKARLYHSAALLLPDASVLVSGGGAPGPQNNLNAEIFFPPYLYDGDALAVRPQILSAPDTAEVGDVLSIEMDTTNISAVNLVKTGSVTHSVNMDQRFVPLLFTRSGNMLQAALPARATDTPPGYYLMFVLNDEGVPSMANILRINIDATPFIAVDYTPTIGGPGGTPFKLACPSDEIIVGVHGRFATLVNQIGPMCVKVDQLGRWIGDPVNGPVTGTTATGTSFSKTCPRDYAVSGFRGRSDTIVNQLDFQCRALTPFGGLTGAEQYLGPSGGTGGNEQAPQACGTGNPVYALYGRSASLLYSFGVQCRAAVITPISINSSPVIVNPGPQSGIVGIPLNLQINASDGDVGDDLDYTATNLPAGLTIDIETGLITGTPTTANSYNSSVTVSDGNEDDTANFTWTIGTAAPLAVSPMPSQPARLVNTQVTFNASTTGGVNVVYRWDFGDGTPETAYTPSSSVNHTFTEAGVYFVTLTVNDDFGIPNIQTFVQTVHLPLTANRPASSSNIAYETRTGNDRVWVVNQDNNSVTVIDAVTNAKLSEVSVGTAPRAVAVAPDGRVWVTNKGSSNISIISPVTLGVAQTVAMPRGSAPYGIVFSAAANDGYVVLEGTGRLLKVDASTGGTLLSTNTGPNPRHVSINAARTAVYVTRFITPRQPGEETANVQSDIGGVPQGGELLVFASANLILSDTIVLQHSNKADAENQGSGVPNYLGAAELSPDGTVAWVPSKMDNIKRGSLRNGLNINFQSTVRAIGSSIDLAAVSETYAKRIDFDDASIASAAAFDPLGIYLFVSLETSREIAVVDAHGAYEIFRINAGRAPQGLVVSPDGEKLFVNNFMNRTVGIYDLGELKDTGLWTAPLLANVSTVAAESLSAQVLNGKQLFYDAFDTRLARDRYLSCATCHNDGGQDGRVWDLTGMGEGLRNTINLHGSGADHGKSHWSQNFDEIQDFEGQIRALSGGTGLMTNAAFNQGTRSLPLGDPKAGISADLDALAAYVSSLDEFAASPYRNADGSLTPDGAAGRAVFQQQNCAACHGGTEFTDSDSNVLHDIGTLKASSGSRLGGPLTGIDTPTLRGAWASAPYLHDGSAATLEDAIEAHNGINLSVPDLGNLVAYLKQVDIYVLAAPLPNDGPEVIFNEAPTGLLVMEAENFSRNLAGTTVGPWSVITEAGASNTSAIKAPAGGFVAQAADTAVTEYPANIVVAGNHYVWVRFRAFNAGSDSMFVKVDGMGAQQLNLSPVNGTWAWKRVTNPYFLDAGGHVFKMLRRERDVEVDKIVVTTNPNYPTPVGVGPAESPRSGGGGNQAPILAAIGNQSVVEGATLTIDLSATDGDGNNLVFSQTGLPAFASLTDHGDGTAEIVVMPQAGDAQAYPLEVFVNDDGIPSQGDSEVLTLTVVQGGTNVFQQDGSGLLVMEAENYGQNLPGTTVGPWSVITEAGASNTSAIKAPAGGFVAQAADTAVTEYPANIVVAGNHYVWVRFRAFNAGSDSMFVKVDGMGAQQLNLSPVNGTWAWKRVTNPYFLDAGGHVFKMLRRERDVEVDKIVVTTNPNYPTPVGVGPAESPRSGGGGNQAPILAAIGNQSVVEGATLTIDLSATDGDGNNLVFSQTGLPAFASLTDHGDGTAEIVVMPQAGDAQAYPLEVFVNDDGIPSQGDSEVLTLTVVQGGTNVFQQDGSGLLVMEAENYGQNLPGTTVGPWSVITEAGASNTSAIKAPAGGFVAQAADTAVTEYPANIVVAGNHYVWVRFRAFNAGSDSMFVKVDGMGAQQLNLSPVNGTWAWKRVTNPYFLDAGGHVFKMLRREKDTEVDKILVTTNANYPTPVGVGPAESMMQ